MVLVEKPLLDLDGISLTESTVLRPNLFNFPQQLTIERTQKDCQCHKMKENENNSFRSTVFSINDKEALKCLLIITLSQSGIN